MVSGLKHDGKPTGLGTVTGPEAEARLREIADGIRRAKSMNIVGLIPDLEKERALIMQQFIKAVK